MQKVITICITDEQVKYLASRPELGVTENIIRKILDFKMPDFNVVKEYQEQINKENMRIFIDDTKVSYHFYNEQTSRLQRRLIRYLGIFLAMDDKINLENHPQVLNDLIEVDIDINSKDSIQSGWERVSNAFEYALKEFLTYSKEAANLSSYDKIFSIEWISCCNDDERFGPECLCVTSYMTFLENFGFNNKYMKYVSITSNQARQRQIEEEQRELQLARQFSSLLKEITF